ncbi:MAG: hypothetical protein OEV06_11525, partial [Anaerolineae bacterium]|nr:hypothetical protein [Anaerolineae bacterium]
DRNHCQLWQAACESCFGGRVMLKDFDIEGCVMKIEEEGDTKNISIFMHDRDGTDKELLINEENWPDAYNSWMLLYEKQQAGENNTIK